MREHSAAPLLLHRVGIMSGNRDDLQVPTPHKWEGHKTLAQYQHESKRGMDVDAAHTLNFARRHEKCEMNTHNMKAFVGITTARGKEHIHIQTTSRKYDAKER